MPTATPEKHKILAGETAGWPNNSMSESSRQRALFARVREEADKAALHELVERFTPLAHSLARRYSRSSEPYEDLSQVAQLGLIKAIQRFDPDRGVAFASFAVPTILGELRRHFRGFGWVAHVPRSTQENALRLRDSEPILAGETGRSPTVEQLAKFTNMSSEQVLDAMQALRAVSSVPIDAPAAGEGSEDHISLAETIGGEDARLDLIELEATLSPALTQLSARQREMLKMRYTHEMTQSQIGEHIGVSQMQVSRLLQQCLDRLRELTGESQTPE